MPTIKNIGKQMRMVVDRYLLPGDTRYIAPKRVDGFRGDPDFEIVDETPEAKAEGGMQKAEVTLLKVHVMEEASDELESVPASKRLVVTDTEEMPSPQPAPVARGKKRGKKQ